METSPVFARYAELYRKKWFAANGSDEELAKFDVVEIIYSLKNDVGDYADKPEKKLTFRSSKGRTLRGVIRFLLQNFQYRYVSVQVAPDLRLDTRETLLPMISSFAAADKPFEPRKAATCLSANACWRLGET